MRVDTSSLPDDAQVSSATLTVYVVGKSDADGRSLIGSWYPGSSWPIDASDHVADVGTTALSGTTVASLPVGAKSAVSLVSPGQVSVTGYTGLRLGLSGGAPSGDNYLQIASADGSKPAATLTVTYTVP